MQETVIIRSYDSVGASGGYNKEDHSSTNTSSVARTFSRCVRRTRSQCVSQLPVRCQRTVGSCNRRPPARSLFKLSGLSSNIKPQNVSHSVSTKSCPDNSSPSCLSILRAIGTPRYKKSLSMIDLSPITNDSVIGDLRSDGCSTPRLQDNGNGALSDGTGSSTWAIDSENEGIFQTPNKAAKLLCRVLILNAWRRRRDEVAHLQNMIDKFSQQIEHLHIQIVVLRRLLEAENNRVGRLSGEAHRVKIQLGEVSRERDTLKMEKRNLEEDLKVLSEASEEQSVKVENLRNDLLTAQSQLQAMDVQMSKDREKLLMLREDKRILLEKVSVSEVLSTERNNRVERAESAIQDLQIRLAAQVALVESSQQKTELYCRELKQKDEEKLKLEKLLRLSADAGKALNTHTINLENQLSEKEAALRRLDIAYHSQLLELNELRERLIRQSQEGGWSNRVLQIAGSVVRAPRAILRTLSFLSSTAAPLPS